MRNKSTDHIISEGLRYTNHTFNGSKYFFCYCSLHNCFICEGWL